MKTKKIVTKILVLVVFALWILPISAKAYSYWNDLSNSSSENVTLGAWWAIPISTPQEFYDMATNPNSTSSDSYYLANNIDFTGFNWVITSSNYNVAFRGIFDGNGYSIQNLTITSNSLYNSYLGIFPRMEGATVQNLTLQSINLVLDSTTINQTNTISGLLSAEAFGLTNTIRNITVINSGVRGTSTSGTGGLVGVVSGASTILDLSNVKTSGIKIFSTTSSAGGLVGSIFTSGASVSVSDIELHGEVSAMGNSSFTGGVIGSIVIGAVLDLRRAIVDMNSQNTLETNPLYYQAYSEKYLGGFIGDNQSSNLQVTLDSVFFTGSLITNTAKQYTYIGTAVGRSSGSETITNAYYSMVAFRDRDNTITYNLTFRPKGVMATLVNETTMPSMTWWNNYATSFYSANSLWTQNASTGMLELIR